MPEIAYLTYMQVAYISGQRFVHLRTTYSEVTKNIVYFLLVDMEGHLGRTDQSRAQAFLKKVALLQLG